MLSFITWSYSSGASAPTRGPRARDLAEDGDGELLVAIGDNAAATAAARSSIA